VLFGCAAALALGTLYFCMPAPEIRGYAIEARVRACRPAAEAIDAAIADWDKRIAAVTWAKPRAGWQDDARQMPLRDAGVVLDLQISRRNAVLEHRKPWDKGRFSATGWQTTDAPKSFFARNAGGICANYPVGSTAIYFPQNDAGPENDKPWPPTGLPDFLNLQVLDVVPAQYAKLVER
jgi:hypothetical protein